MDFEKWVNRLNQFECGNLTKAEQKELKYLLVSTRARAFGHGWAAGYENCEKMFIGSVENGK